jgi:hypothetical protein
MAYAKWQLCRERTTRHIVWHHDNELLATMDAPYAVGGHLDGFEAGSYVYRLLRATVRTRDNPVLRLNTEGLNLYVSGHRVASRTVLPRK